ncbi:MAG: SBBP repeat-containing protein [Taibaiella sp.]|nr:SBBP repeat-containing protein [Taibaiella sp.]
MMNRKCYTTWVLFLLTGLWTSAFAHKGFIANIGQVTDQYYNSRQDIIARYPAGNGLNLFLSNTGIYYQFATASELYRVDVKLIGADPAPRISYDKPDGSREIYHLSSTKGIALAYQRVTYHNIYPNIDWVFYVNTSGQVEHDFIIHPGGKVSDIKLQYNGADQLYKDKKGNLIAATRYGSIKEPKPYTYELSSQRQVSSNYVLQGNLLTFKTADYKGTLVIDPVIDWATYFGDSEYDEINDVKIGKDGYIYTIGSTNSTANIATTGAHLTTFQGGTNSNGADAFIAKFDSSGALIWSTYYGGTTIDIGLSLAIDTAGLIYAAGRTNSPAGIATTGSHKEIKTGSASSYDAFLLKLDTAGSPVWATYFGGNGNEGTTALSITLDRYNNIYMAGNTNSPSGLATPGAFQAVRPGSEEGFMAKFNAAGNLHWATYYGSTSADYIYKITSDNSGDIIVVGHTVGTTGLSTPGASLVIGNGGSDGFVAKFDSTGQRMWGTYYGGNDFERMMIVTADSANNIYIAGLTNSATGLATANAHQTVMGSTGDGCIAKLSPSGIIEWSTYFGGNEDDAVTGLKFSNGKLYVTGWTASTNNITTLDGMIPVFNGSASEGFLATFTPNGQRQWASYFGGDVSEDPKAIAVTQGDELIIAGKTASVTGLATTNAHQTSFGGIQDGMLLKVRMCNLPGTPSAITGNSLVCENAEQQFSVAPEAGADSYLWITPNGWTGSSTTDTLNVIAGPNDGDIKVIALNSCGHGDTVSLSVSVNPAPVPIISRNANILSVSQTFDNYQWHRNGDPIGGATNPTYAVAQNGEYTLAVTGTNGCTGISNEITVDNFTSINDIAQLGMEVYPNPFRGFMTITAPMDLQIIITDLSGKQIAGYTIKKGNNEINLSDLPLGNYLLNAYQPKSRKPLGFMTLVKIAK